MSILRDIVDVYNKIIKVIPDENIEFKNDLKKYIDSLWNKAPETFIPFVKTYSKYSKFNTI